MESSADGSDDDVISIAYSIRWATTQPTIFSLVAVVDSWDLSRKRYTLDDCNASASRLGADNASLTDWRNADI